MKNHYAPELDPTSRETEEAVFAEPDAALHPAEAGWAMVAETSDRFSS
jgi:hypothetical protein